MSELPQTPGTNLPKKPRVLLALITGIIVSAAMVYVFLNFIHSPEEEMSTEVIPVPEAIEEFKTPTILTQVPEGVTVSEEVLRTDPVDYSGYYKNLKQQPGVEWFIQPVPRGNLGFVTSEFDAADMYLTPRYFQIGTYNGEPITYVTIPCEGMCFIDDYTVFVGSPDKKVVALERHSSYDYNAEYSMFSLADTVEVNSSIQLEALTLLSVSINGVSLEPGTHGFRGQSALGEFFANSRFNIQQESPYDKMQFVADTEYGPLFKAQDVRFPGTADYVYAVRTVGGLISYFDVPLPFLGDDRVPQITWNDGSINTTMYRMDGLGSCGGAGPEVATDKVSDSDLAPVGKTSSGQMVYGIVNPSHPLITRVFETTRGLVYEYDLNTGESSTYQISPQEFIDQHGVIIIVDQLGEQNIFTNGHLGPQAECGKPVIYLYPEETTTISVKLDALVTKSEPLYENGWVVEATPQGVLTHKSGQYTSLFWDGYGNGEYPKLEKGFVVPTSEALDTMGEHLFIMGFNKTEVAEFKEFWKDHLPTEPYTKFSWIQTKEMQKLAALDVQPRPQTVIRAFVDYTGVSEPLTIEPQVLESRERVGYVLTEWGGLIRK